MAKIRNKKTGKVIEVNDKDLHQYGLGRKKLPKALLGKKQHGDLESMYNQGNYDNMQLLPERTDFGQIGNFNKIGGSGMDNPQINSGNTQPNFYNFNTGQYPNTQLPTGYQPNYTYPAQDFGEDIDNTQFQNNDIMYNPNQTYNPNIITDAPIVQTPEFNPGLTQSVVDYNKQMGRGKTNVYGTPEELSQITPGKTNTNINWKNAFPGITGIGGNTFLSKGISQLGSGLTNIGKGSLDILGNKKLANRENFRNATQFGQSVYADAENRPQGQIYGKDIRGGNALFANGGINLKELYTPETNKANIEVEKNEFISIPHMDNGGHSGLSEKVNFGGSHGEITNGSSGTPMNLPANTLVFSVQNKVKKTPLLAPLLEDGLLKAGDIGKPWSSVANKFKTVDDVNRKENKFSDSIQKTTADMLINMKQAKQKRLFEEGQEPEKLYGFQGKKAQLEAIQSLQQEQQMQPGQEQTQMPMGKNGMKLPEYGGGGLTQEDIDLWKSVKYGDVAKNPKLQEIAKKLRASGLVANAWKDAKITGDPGNEAKAFTDDELLASFIEKGYDLNKFLQGSNNQSPSIQKTTNQSTFNTGYNPNVLDPSLTRLSDNKAGLRNNYLPYQPGQEPYVYGQDLNRWVDDFTQRTGIPVDKTEQGLANIRTYQSLANPGLVKDYKINFARGNQDAYNEFTSKKNKSYKKGATPTEESNNFYNWSVKNNKLGQDYIDKGKPGHEYLRTEKLPFTKEEFFDASGSPKDKDWQLVESNGKKYYVDRSAYASSGNPELDKKRGLPPITYYELDGENLKSTTKQPTSDPVKPIDYKFPQRKQQESFQMPNLNMGIPLPYNEKTTPLNYYKTQPEFIDPRYLNVQPQLNDITRGVRTVQNNLGDRSTSSVGNSLQAQINAYGQENQVYGNKYNYDKGQDSQAQQFNAQAKMTTDQYNQNSWYNQLEDPIRARSSAKNKQFKENQQRGLENWNEQIAYNNNADYINKTFYTPQDLNSLNWHGQTLNPIDAKKALKAKWDEEYDKKEYFKQKELGQAKNGGKVKIKPKIKLK